MSAYYTLRFLIGWFPVEMGGGAAMSICHTATVTVNVPVNVDDVVFLA